MKLKCPKCKTYFNLTSKVCQGEQCLKPNHGVIRCMSQNFQNSFLPHEKRFQLLREKLGVRIKDVSLYEKMPFIDFLEDTGIHSWKPFQTDLKLIKSISDSLENKTVLNYGAWNGWLSNHLVSWGAKVTAISYFIDEYDGLGANQHYNNEWMSVQMDVENELEFIEGKFDLIIINRGLAFVEKPAQILSELKEKLNPSGTLILTGMSLYKDPSSFIEKFSAQRKSCIDKYNIDIMFTNTKAFMDNDDLRNMKKLGLQIKGYPNKLLQNFRSKIFRKKAGYYYGVLNKK